MANNNNSMPYCGQKECVLSLNARIAYGDQFFLYECNTFEGKNKIMLFKSAPRVIKTLEFYYFAPTRTPTYREHNESGVGK